MSEQKTIGEHTFTVSKFSATKQMLLKARLLKYAGSAVNDVFASAGTDSASQMGAFASAIGNMISKHSEKEIVNLIKDVTCMAVRDGERMNTARFDEYFQDDLMEVYELFQFVIEVQFANFFGRLKQAS